MLIPTFIEAAGIRIPVIDGWAGPQLEHAAPLEPVAWVANEWIHGRFPDLLDRIERGEDADDAMQRGFFAARPYPEDITDERKSMWRNLTGVEIGDDPVLVGSMMSRPSFLLPRRALVQILHAVAQMRAAAARRPRLPSTLPPDQPIAEPQNAGLFTRTTTDQGPFEKERVALGDVEDAAAALDAVQANVKTEEDRAHAATKRRQLLDQLELHGLLDEARAPEKRAYLEGFRLPKLRDYVDAAMALRAYYRGPTRATFNLGPAPERLLDGNVSLDWFRVPSPPPAGTAPESWLAFAEQLLGENPREGEAGEIVFGAGGRRYHLQWRRDVDRPAVVAACESVR